MIAVVISSLLSVTRLVTLAASAAPMIETPMVPPRLRKKVTPELAAPISVGFARVLDDENQVLHRHADAGTQEEHVERDEREVGVVVDRRQQVGAGDQEDAAHDEERLPLSDAGDQRAHTDRRDQESGDHRDGHEAGLGGRCATGELHVLAEEDGCSEHRDAGRDRRDDGQREGEVAEQREGDERLLGAKLDDDEQDRAENAPPTIRTVSVLHQSKELPAGSPR